MIDDTDDTHRRLLKARLHQCCLELSNRKPDTALREARYRDQLRCQAELLALVIELWANDKAAQVPWLEEVVMFAKHEEDVGQKILQMAKIPEESISITCVSAMRRHRLEAEAALWKAKNPPKAAGGGR